MIDDEKKCDDSPKEDVEPHFAKPEMQKARAFLRERYLRAVTGIVGKPSKFHLHENTTVNGEFRGCDVDGLEIYVRNLQTPLGTIPEAVLRSSDVLHFTVNNVTSQK